MSSFKVIQLPEVLTPEPTSDGSITEPESEARIMQLPHLSALEQSYFYTYREFVAKSLRRGGYVLHEDVVPSPIATSAAAYEPLTGPAY